MLYSRTVLTILFYVTLPLLRVINQMGCCTDKENEDQNNILES